MLHRSLVCLLAGATLMVSASAQTDTSIPLTPVDNRAEWVQTCTDWDEWDKSAPPYRIHGQSYYVGTCGISAILIVGEDGLVLIDSGTREGSEVIAANIAQLGHSINEVKALLVYPAGNIVTFSESESA